MTHFDQSTSARSRSARWAVAGLCIGTALAGLCGPAPALAAGGIKAAFVEVAIPARSYNESVVLSPFGSALSFGPLSGVLGITSLTVTNFDGVAHHVILFVPQNLPRGTCRINGSTPTTDGSGPATSILVQPRSTIHLAFPMPMVINPFNGNTCVAARVATLFTGASVRIDVNGIVN